MMKSKVLITIFLLHFGLSLAGFLGLQGWALSAQDAGTAAPGIGWLEIPVRFALLQPLAHWVLRSVSIAWWTWSGLASLASLILVNSLVAVGVLVSTLRARRAWRSAG